MDLPVSEVEPSNFPFLLLCTHTDHSMHKQQPESTPPPPTATTFITYKMQSQQVPIGIVNKINIILSSYALLPTYATWIHLESRKNYSSTRPQCLHDLSTTRSHRNKPQSVAFYNPTTLYNPSSLAQIFYYDDYSRGHRPHHHNKIHTTFTHISIKQPYRSDSTKYIHFTLCTPPSYTVHTPFPILLAICNGCALYLEYHQRTGQYLETNQPPSILFLPRYSSIIDKSSLLTPTLLRFEAYTKRITITTIPS